MNNKEILAKVDEIIALIKESDDYQKYLSLKKELENNQEINLLINEIKLLQKDVVHHLEKKDHLQEIIKELEEKPLYMEYQNIVYEINNSLAVIENQINQFIDHKIN